MWTGMAGMMKALTGTLTIEMKKPSLLVVQKVHILVPCDYACLLMCAWKENSPKEGFTTCYNLQEVGFYGRDQ